MVKHLISTSSGTFAAEAANEILVQGGSAADAAVAAALVQIVDAAGTYVSFAGMLVGLYYEASTGKVYSIDSDYGIPSAKMGDNLTRLYREGNAGAGVLIPGFFAGIRDMLDRFGRMPLESILSPAVARSTEPFEPSERLLKRLQRRSKTNPPALETFRIENGKVVQSELQETLKHIREFGYDEMYTGQWAENFVQTVQSAGGLITMDDMKNYRAQIREAISIPYRGYQVFAPPPENAGGQITLFILRILERMNLKEQGHFVQAPGAYLKLLSGLRAYMPFLNLLLGNIVEEDLYTTFGGRKIQFVDCLSAATIDAIWQAIEKGDFQPVPVKKPENTDVITALDSHGNIAIIVHSACATTGQDGLAVGGISLPRMAGEYPAGVEMSDKRVPGIFSPIMAISEQTIIALAAIHASLYEKQSTTLFSILEYGLSLAEASALPSPIYPDYDENGQATELLFLEQYEQSFLDGLTALGLRFKHVREGAIARFVGEENLDALESPLVGLEYDRMKRIGLGVTCKHYDGIVIQEG